MKTKLNAALGLLLATLFIFATCKNKQATTGKNLDNTDTLQKWLKTLKAGEVYFGTHDIPDSFKHLIPILDSMLLVDQKYRFGMNKPGTNEFKEREQWYHRHVATIEAADQANAKWADSVIARHGWLGYKQIGMTGYTAMFLIIQHADMKTQERYLPLLKKALSDKKLLPSHYAMLYDRVEMHHRRPQRFGTQIARVSSRDSDIYPLLNPDSVDYYRKELGIPQPFASYLSTFGLKWDLERYKKELPSLKAKYKVVYPRDTLFAYKHRWY
jgi:hypothetical protein